MTLGMRRYDYEALCVKGGVPGGVPGISVRHPPREVFYDPGGAESRERRFDGGNTPRARPIAQ